MLIKASYLILATVFFAATWFVPALSNYASGAAVLTGALFSWFLKNPFQEHSHRLVPTFLGLAIVGMGFGMNLAEVLRADGQKIALGPIGSLRRECRNGRSQHRNNPQTNVNCHRLTSPFPTIGATVILYFRSRTSRMIFSRLSGVIGLRRIP